METQQCYCPKCGSKNLQTVVTTDVKTSGKNYSVSQGCCGAFMFGPLGVLCGLCGQGQQTTTTHVSKFACNNCGHEFLKREELEKAVANTEKMKNLSIPVAAIISVLLFIISAAVIQDGGAIGLFFFIYLIVFAIAGVGGYYMNKVAYDKAIANLAEYDKTQEYFASQDQQQDENV